jgi:hypothetical protein
MCICQQPDKRSDYTLLKLPSNTAANVQPFHRRRDHDNQNEDGYLASQEYAGRTQQPNITQNNEFNGDFNHASKWEIGVRVLLILFLTISSISIYHKQKDLDMQRQGLQDSIQKFADIKRERSEKLILKEKKMLHKLPPVNKDKGNQSVFASIDLDSSMNIMDVLPNMDLNLLVSKE